MTRLGNHCLKSGYPQHCVLTQSLLPLEKGQYSMSLKVPGKTWPVHKIHVKSLYDKRGSCSR